LPAATTDVEVVSVVPAQPEGDVSSTASRAGTPEPWLAWPESRTPGLRMARGGVEVTMWGAAEVVGTARKAAEVTEVGDGGAAQGQMVGPPVVAIRSPAPVSWVI
jgi:hypothetical protein